MPPFFSLMMMVIFYSFQKQTELCSIYRGLRDHTASKSLFSPCTFLQGKWTFQGEYDSTATMQQHTVTPPPPFISPYTLSQPRCASPSLLPRFLCMLNRERLFFSSLPFVLLSSVPLALSSLPLPYSSSLRLPPCLSLNVGLSSSHSMSLSLLLSLVNSLCLTLYPSLPPCLSLSRLLFSYSSLPLCRPLSIFLSLRLSNDWIETESMDSMESVGQREHTQAQLLQYSESCCRTP